MLVRVTLPSPAAATASAEAVLALCDALRPLTDPADVIAVARARLGEQLAADVGWEDLEPGADPLGADPDTAAALRDGRTVVAAGDDGGEQVLVPVAADGRLRAVLSARRSAPFAPAEVGLAEAAAPRVAIDAERATVVAAAVASGERVTLALDAARIGTFVWDPVADRTQGDDRLMALLAGQAPADLSLAQLLERVVHPEHAAAFAAAVAAVLDPGGPGRIDRVVRLARDGGDRHPVTHVRVTGRAAFAGAGGARRAVRVVGAVIDVSEQERAREDLRRAAAHDAVRVALTGALRTSDDPGELERAALELVAGAFGASRVVVADAAGDDRDGAALGPGVRAALREGRPLVIDDVRATALPPGEHAAADRLGIRALATTAPVRGAGGPIALVVHRAAPHRWTADELALLDEVAERLRAAVRRARAEAALHETGARLHVAQSATRTGFASWDPVADRTELDERARAVFGEVGGAPLRETLARVLHPDDLQPFLDAVLEAGAPGADGRYHEVVRVRAASAPQRWAAVTGQYLFAGTGEERRPVHVVATVNDVTDRVLAEQALARATEHDRFLLVLTEALRPLGDPGAVQRAGARTLRDALDASRVFYAEITEERWGRVREEQSAPGVPSVVGSHRLDELGAWLVDELHDDQTIAVADVLTDPRVAPAEARAYLDREVRAVAAVPLVKDGRLVALLGVHQREPRTWASDELALAEDTAERTWAAVERARAQSALRARTRPRRRG